MRALLMGHLHRDLPAFLPYNPLRFKHKGVFFGLWAWRNILKMDTFYGPVMNDKRKLRGTGLDLDNYDMAIVVGLKSKPKGVDGIDRCGWLKKHYPHLKIALTADISEGWYANRAETYTNWKSKIITQMGSADIFLQLCWAYIKELRDYFGMRHIYTVLPVDFDEYERLRPKLTGNPRDRNLIAVSRHNERSHVNAARIEATCRVVKRHNPSVRFRFFTLSKPEHIQDFSLLDKYQWTYHRYFTDLVPFLLSTEFLSKLSECGMFMDNVVCSSAGPRMMIHAGALGIPTIANTGLSWTMLPELATTVQKYFLQPPDNFGEYARLVSKMLNNDTFYNITSSLVYDRFFRKCRGEASRRRLIQLLNLKYEGASPEDIDEEVDKKHHTPIIHRPPAEPRDITAVILCGGWHERWNLDVNGEPSIKRTVRLLREEGVNRIVINIAWNKKGIQRLFLDDPNIIWAPCPHHYKSIDNRGNVKFMGDDPTLTKKQWNTCHYVYSCYAMMHTIDLWGDDTLIIPDDTLFTRAVLREILDHHTNEFAFFGKDYANPEKKVLWELSWKHGVDLYIIRIGPTGKRYLATLTDPFKWKYVNGDLVENYFVQSWRDKIWYHLNWKFNNRYPLITPKASYIVEVDSAESMRYALKELGLPDD